MASDHATPPAGDDMPVEANSTGPDRFSDNKVKIDEVAPVPGRSDGTSESAREAHESVQRQRP